MKYSKSFERDYAFYLKNIDVFNFCGTLNPRFEAIGNGIKSAKEVFYLIDSHGKNEPTVEPYLLNKLLLTKASVNFQIKQWSEARAEGVLPLSEFSKDYCYLIYPEYYKEQKQRDELEKLTTLEWIGGEPVYFRDIKTQYGLPDWVIYAVESQFTKLLGTKLLA
jgi:hypothetical protein